MSDAGYQASQLAHGMDRWRKQGLPVDGHKGKIDVEDAHLGWRIKMRQVIGRRRADMSVRASTSGPVRIGARNGQSGLGWCGKVARPHYAPTRSLEQHARVNIEHQFVLVRRRTTDVLLVFGALHKATTFRGFMLHTYHMEMDEKGQLLNRRGSADHQPSRPAASPKTSPGRVCVMRSAGS